MTDSVRAASEPGWRWRTLGVALLLPLGACYPERSVDEASELDLVATARSPDVDFGSYGTFAVVDSFPSVGNDVDDGIDGATGIAIKNRIRQNMTELGFTEVDPSTTTADVYVAAGAVTSSNTVVGWWDGWYDWWGGWPYWPGWYGPGWDWYYPGYWYTYSYEAGTLVMVMVEGGASQSANRSAVLWFGTVNGVLTGNDTGRVLAGIDQAFDQSPYLGGQ